MDADAPSSSPLFEPRSPDYAFAEGPAGVPRIYGYEYATTSPLNVAPFAAEQDQQEEPLRLEQQPIESCVVPGSRFTAASPRHYGFPSSVANSGGGTDGSSVSAATTNPVPTPTRRRYVCFDIELERVPDVCHGGCGGSVCVCRKLFQARHPMNSHAVPSFDIEAFVNSECAAAATISADYFNRIVDEAHSEEFVSQQPKVAMPETEQSPNNSQPAATTSGNRSEFAELKDLLVSLINTAPAMGTAAVDKPPSSSRKRAASATAGAAVRRSHTAKRKVAACESVTLWTFVETLARNCNRIAAGQLPLRDAEFKRAKLDNDDDAAAAAAEDPENTLRTFVACVEMYESLSGNGAAAAADDTADGSAAANFLFSREYLKFFMATYVKFLEPADFVFKYAGTVETNAAAAAAAAGLPAPPAPSQRRQRALNQLPPGGILAEYAKGPECFVANVGRADRLDVEALKLLFRHGLRLPERIYGAVPLQQQPAVYEYSSAASLARQPYRTSDFVHIPISSTCKRVFVLISGHVIMSCGRLPSRAIERDFAALMRCVSEKLGGVAPYIVLDVIVSTNQVIDLVDWRRADSDVRPPAEYAERLALLRDLFPTLRCAINSIDQRPSDEIITSSYIRKHLTLPPLSVPTLVYVQPNPTALVIAVSNKTAHIAFRDTAADGAESLYVQTHCDIAGTAALHIMSAEVSQEENDAVVEYAGRRYRIANPPSSARLLARGVAVEIREGDKLGAPCSDGAISTLDEYRQPVTTPVTAAPQSSSGSSSRGVTPAGAVASAVSRAAIVSADGITTTLIDENDTEQLIELIRKSNNYDAIVARLMSHKSGNIVLPLDQYEKA